MSQAEKLLEILSDGERHTVPELIRRVYGLGNPSSARLAARVYDLRRRGYEIESDETKRKTIWFYRMKPSTRVWKRSSRLKR